MTERTLDRVSANRYPGATWAPLPESGSHGRYVKTQLIYHSTGTRASAAANRRYFASSKVQVESTFIVDYDGGCLQVMEAYEKADANMTASRRSISVEVVGLASEPYTPEQVARCIDIGRWATSEHPIELRQCPAPDASGMGWHVMFGAPGPWTAVAGKECPGDERIAQVRGLIIPTVCRLPDPPTPPPAATEDTDMRVIYAPNRALCLLRGDGRLWPLDQNADASAYEAAGIEVRPLTNAQWDQIDGESKRIAQAGL